MKKEITFAKALDQILIGKKVTKGEWNNPEIYGFLQENLLCLHKEDGANYNWIISQGDISGEDYVVLD